MPNILVGNAEYANASTIGLSVNYNYDYPNGLDLRPHSKLHLKIKDKIVRNSRDSATTMSHRFASWRTMDETLTTYIQLDDDEEDVISDDNRKPVSIVFPYTYAILESLMAYMVAAFFQDPLFRFEGTAPEDTIGAILLEKIVEHQMNKYKAQLALHTMFRDSMVYGIGVIAPQWKKKHGNIITLEEQFSTGFLGLGQRSTGFERVSNRGLLYEGNKFYNIDPYSFLPDPNVSSHEIQDGEFVGWVESTNLMTLLNAERDGEFFNVKYIKHLVSKKTSIYNENNSGRGSKVGTTRSTTTDSVANPVDILWQYITLIPKEEGLGKSEYPEKYLVAIAGDELIIQLKPLGLNHDMFPVALAAPDFDGYSANPISRIEVMYGLQGTLNWLFNSHIANVRKAINDMFVVDPYSININDVEDPQAGKLIRTRKPMWGKGVDGAIMQLKVSDVTRGNIADSAYIIDSMQKVAGADNPVMGSMRQGGPERLTSAEFKGTAQGAVNRLERVAKVVGLQAMQDLGYMCASHTQQLMEKDTKVKMSGRWLEDLIKEYGEGAGIVVDPDQLIIDYDIMVRDGSVPGGNYSDVMLQMFNTIAGNEELATQFDVGRIFKHIARSSGATNVEEFVRIKTMPDDQVEEQARQGNLASTEEVFPGG